MREGIPERIPQRVDYQRYTDQGVTLDGVISLQEAQKDLVRFNDSIIENTGDIKYQLVFDRDLLGNRIVTGEVAAEVILQCQRCMDNFKLDLNCHVSIAFVQNDFEQQQAEDFQYDIFWLKKKELFDPRVLIEDELLLALPQIPMHPESEIGQGCDVIVKFLDEDEVSKQDKASSNEDVEDRTGISQSEQNDEDNPFAILKQLKK